MEFPFGHSSPDDRGVETTWPELFEMLLTSNDYYRSHASNITNYFQHQHYNNVTRRRPDTFYFDHHERVMQLNLFYFFCDIPEDATEMVASNSSRDCMQSSTICRPRSQPWCSDVLEPTFTIQISGMKVKVSLQTTIELPDLSHYLG